MLWTVWTFADPEYTSLKTAHIFFRLKYDGGKALRLTSSDALYHPYIFYFLLKLPVKKSSAASSHSAGPWPELICILIFPTYPL